MKRFLTLILAGGLCAAMATATANETIYKWVDAEGVTHYSPHPPDGIEYERLTAVGGSTRAGTSTDETTAEPSPEAMPEMPAVQRGETGPDPEVVAERCEQARQNLAELTESTRIILREEDGSEQLLDQEGRQRTIEETEAFIEEWC
jgi:hypothetical protein